MTITAPMAVLLLVTMFIFRFGTHLEPDERQQQARRCRVTTSGCRF